MPQLFMPFAGSCEPPRRRRPRSSESEGLLPRRSEEEHLLSARMAVAALLQHFEGDDRKLADFLSDFPSCILRIPSPKMAAKALQSLQTLRVLSKDPSPETIRRLASMHGATPRMIRKQYLKLSGLGVKKRRFQLRMGCRVASRLPWAFSTSPITIPSPGPAAASRTAPP